MQLASRCRRLPARRWVYVEAGYGEEAQRGGVLIETSWLPADAAQLLGPGFDRGTDGHYRAVIPSDEYSGVTLGRTLQRVGAAFVQERDECQRRK